MLLVREEREGESNRDDGEGVERLRAVVGPAAADPAVASDWKEVHRELMALGKARVAHAREVCRWLLAAQRLGVHARLGYASVGELGERLLGLGGRQVEERLRVGRALSELRMLDAALAGGEVAWCTVRELTRVATPETEEEWLGWAKGRRAREVEAAVAARVPGDGPKDRGDPGRVAHRLRFEVRAETMAMFRDLQSAVRKDLAGAVDDDALLYEIARRALGGPGDEGRASYQVAVVRCDGCGRSHVDAGGAGVPVDRVVAEMAGCDAQVLGAHGDVGGLERGLSTVGGRPHVGDRSSIPRGDGRATQSIPPAVRRAVVRRDRRRCVVPGCMNHRFLDVHHVHPRAEGGGHAPEGLAVLCGAHHRAVHRGALCIEGTATTGFVVRHGDGTAYGSDVGVARLDHARQVLDALVHMGFRATRARAMLDAALRAGAAGGGEGLLRAALRGA